jgi:hypothetical protein
MKASAIGTGACGALLIEWQSSPQSQGVSAQGEINLQTIHHRPKAKSKITIKGVSVESQRWVAGFPSDWTGCLRWWTEEVRSTRLLRATSSSVLWCGRIWSTRAMQQSSSR